MFNSGQPRLQRRHICPGYRDGPLTGRFQIFLLRLKLGNLVQRVVNIDFPLEGPPKVSKSPIDLSEPLFRP